MRKRLLGCLFTAGLVVVAGCGERSYEMRLKRTLEYMEYQQRLDQYLAPAATEQGFADSQIFLRVPTSMHLAGGPGLALVPGQFDLAATFEGSPPKEAGSSKTKEAPPVDPNTLPLLHVLARVKKPKPAEKKEGEPPAEEAERGDFIQDVRAALAGNFQVNEADLPTDLKADTRKKPITTTGSGNAYKRLLFTAPLNNHVIRVFFYEEPDYNVALIWDLPPEQDRALSTPIDLALQSFAVGSKASRAFQGLETEGPGSLMPGGEATEGAQGQVF